MATLLENERSRPRDRAATSENVQLTGEHHDHIDPTGMVADIHSELATAEQAVVGACILSEPQRRRVHAVLNNDDITDGICKMLDAAMRAMDAENLPVDPITLAGYIEEHRLTSGLALRHVRSTIAAVTGSTPTPGNAMHYGALVVQSACRRTLIAVGEEMLRLADIAPMEELLAAVGDQGRRAMAAIARAAAVAA